ncbi:hypothetical protein GLOTRDRAFT_131216 [Gloeophyllum trabeum ATCC 11539]|uniref:Uncharacterized protein n=1 Tax=Gloeophyllum trabeum (strain ATCC 11539 / FP-39264 / Madison 617) TaxID=670483 RepID=S7PZ52_GLOTA|nr:uncharacterized protein GLOTRDRAFT_131216 [Gloeophyllum trabeum ATCC 11539]EPQ52926.1 hypothetical protein GLOTRDRAFT_131216 [Gloeophyllum trabeum ATCC 11539]
MEFAGIYSRGDLVELVPEPLGLKVHYERRIAAGIDDVAVMPFKGKDDVAIDVRFEANDELALAEETDAAALRIDELERRTELVVTRGVDDGEARKEDTGVDERELEILVATVVDELRTTELLLAAVARADDSGRD